ncbi:class I SAM-dependent methyltransferase [Actinophytocola sp.]|uniref:class I SAM-dependent methyltransferase n=1 Tax=Actinophytocola sp. TaxID=1872138 RepID=UPI00345BB252
MSTSRPRPCRTARDKARDRDLNARFRQHDATRLADLGETFDTVLDCGLFHALPEDGRAAYVAALRDVLEPGGRYIMLGMSDAEPSRWGGRMRHLTQAFIKATFAEGWQVDTIEPATIEITTDPEGVRAWLATVTRI